MPTGARATPNDPTSPSPHPHLTDGCGLGAGHARAPSALPTPPHGHCGAAAAWAHAAGTRRGPEREGTGPHRTGRQPSLSQQGASSAGCCCGARPGCPVLCLCCASVSTSVVCQCSHARANDAPRARAMRPAACPTCLRGRLVAAWLCRRRSPCAHPARPRCLPALRALPALFTRFTRFTRQLLLAVQVPILAKRQLAHVHPREHPRLPGLGARGGAQGAAPRARAPRTRGLTTAGPAERDARRRHRARARRARARGATSRAAPPSPHRR